MLLRMVWRWRAVCAAKGSWIEGVVARVGCRWQAHYGSGHSARRHSAIRHIPAQGNVSGFFGHARGDDEGIEKAFNERGEWE